MKLLTLILIGLSALLTSCSTTAKQQTPAPIRVTVDPARGIILTNPGSQPVELKFAEHQPIKITDDRGHCLPRHEESPDFSYFASVDASTPLAMMRMQHERFPGANSLITESLMPEYAADQVLLKPGSTHLLPAEYSNASPPQVALCAEHYDATQTPRIAGVSGKFIFKWRYPGSRWKKSPPLPVQGRLDLRRLSTFESTCCDWPF